MRIRFTPRAVENLTEIAGYLRERNPSAAARVRMSIVESLNVLKTFPAAGRLQSTPGVRKLTTRRYAYLVYYAVNEPASEIVVLSIRHPARQRRHDDA